MYKSIVYEGDKPLGEVEIYPQNNDYYYYQNLKNEIRISQYSQSSGRCSPLAVLHAITNTATSSFVGGLCFKMESISQSREMLLLHSSCISDKKTAVIISEKEELHLVAIPSRKNAGISQCFWGFRVPPGLYNSCLVMLNLRCLGIVFDLDETLVVANTKRSFEDKIESLQRKLSNEVDPQRINGMLAEIKRYQDDKVILMQYVESDQVIENGRVINSQSEVVPALSSIYPSVVRPIIRLQDKNIILTRINPQIRDTSVLVRLRPAWDDLRSYLIARGRKRFEVFVCTMAERDYALEMWRLLDPDFNLINSNQLLDRLVCVKYGSRKSLLNVFQKGICHPKMALVIDDRLKVWDEEDQPRVHVVPAFAPYHAPQAEANNATPVLCVARNVACTVRGGFFKNFDDGMLQTMSQVMYEDDIKELPSSPDVSKYLTSETDASALYASKVSVGFDGMADAEVEKKPKEAVPAPSTIPLTLNTQDPRFAHPKFAIPPLPIPNPPSTFQVPFSVKPLPQMPPLVKPEVVLHSSPAREEGEIPETELDPDTRRRLLILQHGQVQNANMAVEPQIHVPRTQENPMLLHHMTQPLNSEVLHIEKQRQNPPPFRYEMDGLFVPNRVLENHRFSHEALPRDDGMRQNYPMPSYNSFPGEELAFPPSSSPSVGNLDFQRVRFDLSETPAGALQDIAVHCGTKVDFRSAVVPSMNLQFSVEVLFGGKKVGEAIGRTRREAQRQAAEMSLINLAEKYLSGLKPDYVPLQEERNMSLNSNENGYAVEDLKNSGSITALQESCMMEGFGIAVQSQPPPLDIPIPKHEVYAQVEVDGHVMGEATGLTWDDAKMQAAEKAHENLQNMLGQFSQKRQGSPREFEGMSNKRPKPEYSQVYHQTPSFR